MVDASRGSAAPGSSSVERFPLPAQDPGRSSPRLGKRSYGLRPEVRPQEGTPDLLVRRPLRLNSLQPRPRPGGPLTLVAAHTVAVGSSLVALVVALLLAVV